LGNGFIVQWFNLRIFSPAAIPAKHKGWVVGEQRRFAFQFSLFVKEEFQNSKNLREPLDDCARLGVIGFNHLKIMETPVRVVFAQLIQLSVVTILLSAYGVAQPTNNSGCQRS
jgi:hypothetical protein